MTPPSSKIATWLGLTDADATLILTAALVLITGMYAYLTWQLVREAQRRERPYVYIATARVPQFVEVSLELRNAGSRVAQNVRVAIDQDAMVWRFAPGAMERVPFSTLDLAVEGVPYLVPGEVRGLGLVYFSGPKNFPDANTRAPQKLQYTVTYHDGGGQEYSESYPIEFTA